MTRRRGGRPRRTAVTCPHCGKRTGYARRPTGFPLCRVRDAAAVDRRRRRRDFAAVVGGVVAAGARGSLGAVVRSVPGDRTRCRTSGRRLRGQDQGGEDRCGRGTWRSTTVRSGVDTDRTRAGFRHGDSQARRRGASRSASALAGRRTARADHALISTIHCGSITGSIVTLGVCHQERARTAISLVQPDDYQLSKVRDRPVKGCPSGRAREVSDAPSLGRFAVGRGVPTA